SYVDLVTLDLPDYDHHGRQDRLAEQLKQTFSVGASKASSGQNPGQSPHDNHREAGARLHARTTRRLTTRPSDTAAPKDSNYNGGRRLGSVELRPRLKGHLEFYNIRLIPPPPRRSGISPASCAIMRTIETFHRHMHERVTCSLLRLALAMGLPDRDARDGHLCDSSLRYIPYRTRPDGENRKHAHLYLRGHRDNGTLTFPAARCGAAAEARRRDRVAGCRGRGCTRPS
ncbi:hypothetical protein E4U53_005001, partial [Claviceps sorghi]